MCDQDSVPACSNSITFEYISTQRGGQLLLYEGRRYHLKKTYKNSHKIWVCCNKKYCKGSVTLSDKQIKVKETVHVPNCLQSLSRNIVAKHVDQLKKDVTTNYDPIPRQYFSMVSRLHGQCANSQDMPKYTALKSTLYRRMKKSLGVRNIQFETPDKVKVPPVFNDFLVADYEYFNNRILIFGSEYARTKVYDVDHFYLDGTFKSCSKPFTQIYGVHGKITDAGGSTKIIPLFYALLTNKDKKSYEVLFMLLKSQFKSWKPQKFTLDFEASAIEAIRVSFPKAEIKGCFYHFNRCLWRKAKEISLKTSVERRHVALCGGLALIPPQHLNEGWNYILKWSPCTESILKFNEYFKKQWLDNTLLSNMWNCEGEEYRTTNHLEGWHAKINRFLGQKNPTLPRLLLFLKNDASYHSMFEGNKDFNATKKNRDRGENNEKIMKAIAALKESNIIVGHCLEIVSPFAY